MALECEEKSHWRVKAQGTSGRDPVSVRKFAGKDENLLCQLRGPVNLGKGFTQRVQVEVSHESVSCELVVCHRWQRERVILSLQLRAH